MSLVDECPCELVDDETWRTLELLDWMDKGLPPVAGGALDQTHWFLSAGRFVRGEEAYWRSHRPTSRRPR